MKWTYRKREGGRKEFFFPVRFVVATETAGEPYAVTPGKPWHGVIIPCGGERWNGSFHAPYYSPAESGFVYRGPKRGGWIGRCRRAIRRFMAERDIRPIVDRASVAAFYARVEPHGA